MQGGGRRFNKHYKEANPGVDSAISDWPPDMALKAQRGEADQNLQGRNQQYVQDIIPDKRKVGVNIRSLVRHGNQSNVGY
jgi:hypothetical protein